MPISRCDIRSARAESARARLKRQSTMSPPIVSTVTSAPNPTSAEEEAGIPAARVAPASTVCHASPKKTRALARKMRPSRVTTGLASTAEETLMGWCLLLGGLPARASARLVASCRAAGQAAVRLATGAGDAQAEVDRASDCQRRQNGQLRHEQMRIDDQGRVALVCRPPLFSPGTMALRQATPSACGGVGDEGASDHKGVRVSAETIVILGAGMAGGVAARTLRQEG